MSNTANDMSDAEQEGECTSIYNAPVSFSWLLSMDEAIFQLISPRELLKYLSIEIMFLMQNLIVRNLKHKTTLKKLKLSIKIIVCRLVATTCGAM